MSASQGVTVSEPARLLTFIIRLEIRRPTAIPYYSGREDGHTSPERQRRDPGAGAPGWCGSFLPEEYGSNSRPDARSGEACNRWNQTWQPVTSPQKTRICRPCTG